MAQQIEVKVPDIGDFKDVAVIEVLVTPGETVAVDTSLIMEFRLGRRRSILASCGRSRTA